MSKKVNEMTTQELEQLLAEKKKEEKARAVAARKAYIKERDDVIQYLAAQALVLSSRLTKFAEDSHQMLQKQKVKLDEYGAIRKNSKGGFQITTEDGKYKIKYAYNSISDYDERADKAEALLKDFLKDMIKKKQKDDFSFEMVQSLLERNSAGKLEYSRVQRLYQYEDKHTDPRWVEAIKLFKESFLVRDSKMQVLIYERSEKGTYELIPLNFSSM